MKSALSLLLVAGLFSVPALAEDDGAQPAPAERSLERARRLVERLDTNGDGLLSAAELAAGRGARRGDGAGEARPRGRRGDRGGRGGRRHAGIDRAEVLKRFDADGSGRLEDAERATARETLRAELRAKLDTDGNGQVDPAERFAAREARRAEHKAEIDTNGDGAVSNEELDAARERRREAFRARLLERFDANDDGVLDDAERRAARRSVAGRRGRHRHRR